MSQMPIHYTFTPSVPMDEVEGTLHLARLAAEILHGEDRVRLEAKFSIDRVARSVVIDMTGDVGRTLALVFGGYARREFSEAAVSMNQVDSLPERDPTGAAA